MNLPERIGLMLNKGVRYPDDATPAMVHNEVIRAARTVMMSMHANNVNDGQAVAAFADPRNKLAAQLVNLDLETAADVAVVAMWQETAQIVADNPPLTKAQIVAHLHSVAEAVNSSSSLTGNTKVVMVDAVDIALGIGTLRVALSKRHISERTGIPTTTVQRALRRLCRDRWLTLIARGKRHPTQRVANIYRIAPLLEIETSNRSIGSRASSEPSTTYGPLEIPTYGPPPPDLPMDHPMDGPGDPTADPADHNLTEEEMAMLNKLTLQLRPGEVEVALRAVLAARQAEQDRPVASVTEIDTRRAAEQGR